MLKASSGHRLLRFGLSDGHSEITAIEYSHIPSVLEDIPPGTKVGIQDNFPLLVFITSISRTVKVLDFVIIFLMTEVID